MKLQLNIQNIDHRIGPARTPLLTETEVQNRIRVARSSCDIGLLSTGKTRVVKQSCDCFTAQLRLRLH